VPYINLPHWWCTTIIPYSPPWWCDTVLFHVTTLVISTFPQSIILVLHQCLISNYHTGGAPLSYLTLHTGGATLLYFTLPLWRCTTTQPFSVCSHDNGSVRALCKIIEENDSASRGGGRSITMNKIQVTEAFPFYWKRSLVASSHTDRCYVV
jgi:hypothetical protein